MFNSSKHDTMLHKAFTMTDNYVNDVTGYMWNAFEYRDDPRFIVYIDSEKSLTVSKDYDEIGLCVIYSHRFDDLVRMPEMLAFAMGIIETYL